MKIDRLVSIIMILFEKKKVVAKDLANQFEVSLRTIYRDIDAINMAGIPVFANPGIGGGFEILPEYKIDKFTFSTENLSTILMGLSNLSTMIRGDDLVNAISKVKSFVPPENKKDIEFKMNQILVDTSPWFSNPCIQKDLETIKKAMDESRMITFYYIEKNGDEVNRTIEPYQLVLKQTNWYCYAYCHLRHDYRLFKLSRMNKLRLESEKFLPRSYPKPILNPKEIGEAKEDKIILKIHKSLLERFLDYCSFDDFARIDNDFYQLAFPFVDNDYYYDILLGFGPRCECLEPKQIRDKVAQRIMKLNNMYNQQNDEKIHC